MKGKKLIDVIHNKLDEVNIHYRNGELSQARDKLVEVLGINQIDPINNHLAPLNYQLSQSIAITFSSLALMTSEVEKASHFYAQSAEYYKQSLKGLRKNQTEAAKEIQFDISGVLYNLSVIYQNLKIKEKENDNDYDAEKVKEYTAKEREYLLEAAFDCRDTNAILSDKMRHRLATIYYNLAKNYESDSDLEQNLDTSLHQAMQYYQLSQGFANSVSASYVPEIDVFTIDETKSDIKKALKGIKNLLNEPDEEIELSRPSSAAKSLKQRSDAKRETTKKESSKVELRSILAPNNDIANGLSNLDRFSTELQQNPSESNLWKHQQEALINTSNILNRSEKCGYINMATGTGKTKVFSNLVTIMGMETIIIAPTTILVQQTVEEIKKIAPHLDVGTIDSSHKRKGANITVTTYASFERMHNMDAFKNTKLIILDEVHSSLSERRVNAIKSFQEPSNQQITNSSSSSMAIAETTDEPQKYRAEYPIIIGFTATDQFNSIRKTGDFTEVRELLPNKFYDYSIGQGIADKVLHPCKIVELELDDKINQDFLNIIKKRKNKSSNATDEITASDLELLKANEINRILPDLISNVQDPEDGTKFKNKSGLIFALDISHAQAIETEINKSLGNGYAACIHSKMSKNEQAEILRKHKSGEIKTLVNVDMLTVGYDDKKLEYIIDFRPTKSSVRLKQTFGRLTRKDPETPHAKTYIQLIIPNMNIKASDLFNGESRLGEIIPRTSTSTEDTQETAIENHCYYKLKFPYTGPEIERAIENKNTITLNPKESRAHKNSSSFSATADYPNEDLFIDDREFSAFMKEAFLEIGEDFFDQNSYGIENENKQNTSIATANESSWTERFSPVIDSFINEGKAATAVSRLKRGRSSTESLPSEDSNMSPKSSETMANKIRRERTHSPTGQEKNKIL